MSTNNTHQENTMTASQNPITTQATGAAEYLRIKDHPMQYVLTYFETCRQLLALVDDQLYAAAEQLERIRDINEDWDSPTAGRQEGMLDKLCDQRKALAASLDEAQAQFRSDAGL